MEPGFERDQVHARAAAASILSARRDGAQLELSVTDTGDGISADFLPHVFERFRQADGSEARSHGGLGLGLAIVRQIVELHGGTVRAESRGARPRRDASR